MSPDASALPPGVDTVDPFPIDRGDDGEHTPGSYKGLSLRLSDNGAPTVTAVDGVIGLVCIGMSNANQECSDFIQRVAGEFRAEVNPAVRVVNCAVGEDAGVPEVRVLGGIASRVRSKFPSVQAVYSSSRSTGAFAGSVGRGEPLSYEEGHALNVWLSDNPRVDGVWYGWGPYLWAPDCATGVTNGSGVCYVRADFVADGVHPAAGARAKISHMLHARLLTESWYRRP